MDPLTWDWVKAGFGVWMVVVGLKGIGTLRSGQRYRFSMWDGAAERLVSDFVNEGEG